MYDRSKGSWENQSDNEEVVQVRVTYWDKMVPNRDKQRGRVNNRSWRIESELSFWR